MCSKAPALCSSGACTVARVQVAVGCPCLRPGPLPALRSKLGVSPAALRSHRPAPPAGDRALGLQSLPVAFGVEGAKWICVSTIDATQLGIAAYLAWGLDEPVYAAVLVALVLPQVRAGPAPSGRWKRGGAGRVGEGGRSGIRPSGCKREAGRASAPVYSCGAWTLLAGSPNRLHFQAGLCLLLLLRRRLQIYAQVKYFLPDPVSFSGCRGGGCGVARAATAMDGIACWCSSARPFPSHGHLVGAHEGPAVLRCAAQVANDVKYQASAQPFLVFGLLCTGLAIGHHNQLLAAAGLQ